MKPTDRIDVTVVVCTLNRADMLRDALTSLLKLETDERFRFEVLVVDNNSTDHTAEVVAQLAPSAEAPLRYVREERQGHAFARNRGIQEARGDWVASFDDDQVADPRWLIELWSFAQEHGLRSVGGAVHLKLPAEFRRHLSPVCRRLLGESAPWQSPRPYSRKEGPGAGNQLLHRSLFDAVGGYDPAYNARGEDTDLYRRLRRAGIESWFTPRAIVWHVIPAARLEESYLRNTSRHTGHCFAYRDCAEFGRWALAAVLLARVAQAACLNAPRFVCALAAQASEEALAMRCLLWRLEGYSRSAWKLMLGDRTRLSETK